MTFSPEQQEEVNRIIGERLAREKTKYQELEATLDQLKKESKELKTKNEELEAQVTELPDLKRGVLVAEVIQELGLPTRFASRIKGDTREEVVADATSLKADLEAEEVIIPKSGSTDPNPEKKDAFGRLVDHAVNYKK